MESQRIAEIKAREQAATPGLWHHEKDCLDYIRDTNGLNICMVYQREDVAFIAHARTDIPALIAEVERLAAEDNERLNYAHDVGYEAALLYMKGIPETSWDTAECFRRLKEENAQLHAVVDQIDPNFFTRKCRVCGCDWNHPCKGGCSWIGDDLCSKCFQSVIRGENNG